MITIIPRFISVRDWTAQTTMMLISFGTIPKLLKEDEWRGWAAAVVVLPEIAAVNAPRPEGFATWQDWATAFNAQLRLLPN